ncbi:AraC-like DNA-binding protein [Williamsia limnetica]|uniref:AraC-like DNA-binding protein n=1 Tax=Williamsia limnetica TaxID=882452 RepID=A0A318RVT9_WILLI|nr:helix-turn-helix domain-containing protein [Williamsia limnetica]PYE17324.1 AraC-like DNA-binding protein [Williamsia limnetica]
MAVVFDSSTYVHADRIDAARTTFDELSAPATVEFGTHRAMAAVMESWNFGQVNMFRAEMTATRLTRTRRNINQGPAGVLALAFHEYGTGQFEQHGQQRFVHPGDLMIVDLDSPYVLDWPTRGRSRAIHVPYDLIGFSHEDFAHVARHLESNPLYDIVRRHIIELDINRDHEISGNSSHELGEATVSLTRALVTAGLTEQPQAQDSRVALIPRIQADIRARLHDPGLTERSLADRFGFTTHELKKRTCDHGFDIDQWIIAERLTEVRAELLESRRPPDARIARRWGFADQQHLEHAFASTYGMSIQQWWEIRDED